MSERPVANPRLLLSLGVLAGVVFTAIAIYFAVGYTPDSGREPDSRPAVHPTSTAGPAR